jgi:hypothetical protein
MPVRGHQRTHTVVDQKINSTSKLLSYEMFEDLINRIDDDGNGEIEY